MYEKYKYTRGQIKNECLTRKCFKNIIIHGKKDGSIGILIGLFEFESGNKQMALFQRCETMNQGTKQVWLTGVVCNTVQRCDKGLITPLTRVMNGAAMMMAAVSFGGVYVVDWY